MKYKICSTFLCVFVVIGVFSEDIRYKAIRNTALYDSIEKQALANVINEGDVLSKADKSIESSIYGGQYLVKIITKENESGWTFIDDVALLNSDVLPDKIISSIWMNSYNLDVLVKQNRDALFQYEPFWKDGYPSYYESKWWEQYYINQYKIKNIYMEIPLQQSLCLNLNNTMIKRQSNNSYTVSAVCDYIFNGYKIKSLFDQFSEGKKYDFVLVLDGDYLEIYINQKKLFTLVAVTKEIVTACNNLFRGTKSDFSEITAWPRRTDGSMDYPPPPKASVQFLSASDLAQYSYTTTSNLRLRASADTKASVIITLKQGDRVQVVQKGASATIDGITAPWVQVKTLTGETGWCFGGYLSPKP